MDNHPIPQDVTGFQFKLIGTMTLKQFALFGVPAVAAFLLYYSVFPVYVKYPLMFLLGIIGLALAFLPIEGRPADVMIKYFITALFAPNQFFYKKQGRLMTFASIDLQKAKKQATVDIRRDAQKELQLQTYLQTTKPVNNPLDVKETAFLQMLQQYSPAPPPPHKSSAFGLPIHLPKLGFSPFGEQGKDSKAQGANTAAQTPPSAQAQSPIAAPQQAQPKPAEPLASPSVPPAPIMHTPFQKPVVATQPAQSNPAPVAQVPQNDQIASQTIPPPAPSAPASAAQTQSSPQITVNTPHVSKIPKDMAQSLGLPNVPDSPNLITGLVRDPRGNVLANMLVEVKDKQGNPVRAFKTNQLGQFASATPLLNGTYTITFEDQGEQHKFDIIEITAKGEIIPPISVVSHDAREELRKALFN